MADLPFWWDEIPPDARDLDLPNYLARDTLIASYSNWAFSKGWAWEGLRRLLTVLLERREPIPELLQFWAYHAASGQRKPPGQGRGRPDEAERNARIMRALRVLRQHGYTREAAMQEIAIMLHLSFEAVRSAVRRVERDRPF